MQVEIKVDSKYSETKLLIMTDRVTDEINEMIRKLSDESPKIITGFCNETVKILDETDIFRIYSSGGKVYATTKDGDYTLRLRLYELEERLDKEKFVRISNSEIINLKKVKNFDLSYTGTICVCLSDKTVTYVSRRYVARIKHVLGI